MGTFQRSEIKRMEGLATFVQHKICNIDDVVDRAYANSLQPIRQPFGRRTQFQFTHGQTGIPRTKLSIFDDDIDVMLDGVGVKITNIRPPNRVMLSVTKS